MNSNSLPSFVGHYTSGGLVSALMTMDKFQQEAEKLDNKFEMSPLVLARTLSGKYKPPSNVKTWCNRFVKVYYSPLVREAFENAKISARYAYDISDYVQYEDCADVIREACKGKFGNSKFRLKIKEIRYG